MSSRSADNFGHSQWRVEFLMEFYGGEDMNQVLMYISFGNFETCIVGAGQAVSLCGGVLSREDIRKVHR